MLKVLVSRYPGESAESWESRIAVEELRLLLNEVSDSTICKVEGVDLRQAECEKASGKDWAKDEVNGDKERTSLSPSFPPTSSIVNEPNSENGTCSSKRITRSESSVFDIALFHRYRRGRRNYNYYHRHSTLPVIRRGMMFGGLNVIPTDAELDIKPGQCFKCRQWGHRRSECLLVDVKRKFCFNCGRYDATLSTCIRCADAKKRNMRKKFCF